MKKKNKYVVYCVADEGYDSYVIKKDGTFMHNATLYNATIFTKEEALKCKELLTKISDINKWKIKAIK